MATSRTCWFPTWEGKGNPPCDRPAVASIDVWYADAPTPSTVVRHPVCVFHRGFIEGFTAAKLGLLGATTDKSPEKP